MVRWPLNRAVPRLWLRLLSAGLYLLAVFLGAFTSIPYNLPDPFFGPVYSLMEYTATNNDFGYFAPAVSSQIQTSFLVQEPGHPPISLSFLTDNPELNIRINSLVTVAMKEQPLQDVCARSWAAFVLGSYPQAKRVTVSTHAYDIPSMARYRAGQRPRWLLIHRASFERTHDDHLVLQY